MAEQGFYGEGGPSIEFEGLFDDVPNQTPDGSLEVDVSLTTRLTVGAVERGLAISALWYETVIPSLIRRVNFAREQIEKKDQSNLSRL